MTNEPNQHVADAAWSEKKWRSSQNSGERKMLGRRLESGEPIISLIQGSFGPDMSQYRGPSKGTMHRGVAALTDRRVVMLDKGVFGSEEFATIPLNAIESVTDSKGMFMGGVGIQCRGTSSYKIEMISPKGDAALFADAVRVAVDDASTADTDVDPTQ